MSCDSKEACWEERHLCSWPNCRSADSRRRDYSAGISTSEMQFCGEPTSDGDMAAEYMRAWYEAHRETDRDRKGKPWDRGIADSFMLGLMNEARRIEDECNRQTKGPKA